MMGTSLPAVSLTDQAYFYDPHALYARLRSDSPIVRVEADMMIRGTGYLVTSYADVTTLYADRSMSSESLRSGSFAWMMPPIVRFLGDTMVMRDDPDHRRLRSIVHSAFGRSAVEVWRPAIASVTARVIESLRGRQDVDLVEDFAVEVPLRVIAELLGVGAADRDVFHRLVLAMHRLPSGTWGLAQRLRLMSKMVTFLRRVIDHSSGVPSDNLVAAVTAARDGEDKLSEREVLAMIFLLFYAGHDTTSTLLGNSMLELMRHPHQMDVVRSADDAGWDVAVEELLRYVSPVTCGSTRKALEDVEIGGVPVSAGSQVLGMLISANRDESVFANAGCLDVTRAVNPHLSFGFGPHFCLGVHLARMEAVAGLRSLIDAFPDIRPVDPAFVPSYRPNLSMRALRSLPVRLR